MNIEHLKIISDQFQFGLSGEAPQQIPSGPGGGHLCWKVKADKKTYFIKQLDPKIDVHYAAAIARYELCESVAFRFAQQGIPSVFAIRNGERVVTILENTAYIVYPWIEGHALKEIPAENALKIAEILANIHVINLDEPEIEPTWDIHTNDEIMASIEKAISHEKSLSEILQKSQNTLLSMNDRYLSAIPVLKEKTVVTHGDVFPHNVIWQTPVKPFLIDWEAVKKWNPTREAIRTCIAWSKIGDDPSSLPLFKNMLKNYIKIGGPFQKNHVEAALNGLYGSMINWLLYNLELVCSNNFDRNDNAINQINVCLVSCSKLNKLYSHLLDTIIHFT